MEEHLETFLAEQAPAVMTLLADMIAARSVNPPGDVTAVAEHLQRFFAQHGLNSTLHCSTDSKPNVVLSVKGGWSGRRLLLNGHLDTISPGDEAKWGTAVFKLTEKDDKLYGLGVGNMKAGVAALAFATVFLSQHRERWGGEVVFTAVADETIFGPDGAGSLLKARPDLAGDALLCGEGPGFMRPGVAEKGLLWIRIEALAEPAQGMLSRVRSSAIARLAEVLLLIDAMNDHFCDPPECLRELDRGHGDDGFRLSANLGTVKGGHFISQSAERAVAEVDFRLPPGLLLSWLESRIEMIVTAVPGVTWSRIKGWESNWSAPSEAICAAVFHACKRVTGCEPVGAVRLPASDASRWRRLGVPAVCFGPQPLLTSGVDDFIYRRDLFDCLRIYALAALEYLGDAR